MLKFVLIAVLVLVSVCNAQFDVIPNIFDGLFGESFGLDAFVDVSAKVDVTCADLVKSATMLKEFGERLGDDGKNIANRVSTSIDLFSNNLRLSTIYASNKAHDSTIRVMEDFKDSLRVHHMEMKTLVRKIGGEVELGFNQLDQSVEKVFTKVDGVVRDLQFSFNLLLAVCFLGLMIVMSYLFARHHNDPRANVWQYSRRVLASVFPVAICFIVFYFMVQYDRETFGITVQQGIFLTYGLYISIAITGLVIALPEMPYTAPRPTTTANNNVYSTAMTNENIHLLRAGRPAKSDGVDRKVFYGAFFALSLAVIYTSNQNKTLRDGSKQILGAIDTVSMSLASLSKENQALRKDIQTYEALFSSPHLVLTWSGSVTMIPKGWTVCNGENASPDYRNKFLVGAGGLYEVGKSGGNAETTFTEGNMFPHTHADRDFNRLVRENGEFTTSSTDNSPTGEINLGRSGTLQQVGKAEPFSNLPPYTAVYYLCRVRTFH